MPLDEHLHSVVRALAERLGKDMAAVLNARAEALISTLDRLDVDVHWQLWDAVHELERQQRTERMLQELADETEDQVLREAHGDHYEAWLEKERTEVAELLHRWMERRGLR